MLRTTLIAFFCFLALEQALAQSACAGYTYDPLGCTQVAGCCYLSEKIQPRPAPGSSSSNDWDTEMTCSSIDDYKTSRVQSRGLSVDGFLSSIKSNETQITSETLCRVEGSYIDTNTQSLIDPLYCQCTGQGVGLGNYSALGQPFQEDCQGYDAGLPGDRCFNENADCYYIKGTAGDGTIVKTCSSLLALNFNIQQRDPSKSLQANLADLGINGASEIDDSNLCGVYGNLPADLQAGAFTDVTCWTSDPSTSTFILCLSIQWACF